MKRIFSILIFLGGFVLMAKPDTLVISKLEDYQNLAKFSEYARAESVSYKDLNFENRPEDLGSLKGKVVVIHAIVYNDMADLQQVFITLQPNEYWQLRQVNLATGEVQIQYAGALEAHSRLSLPNDKLHFQTELNAGNVYSWYLSSWNKSTLEPEVSPMYVQNEKSFYKAYYNFFYEDKFAFGLSIFFQGAIWIMMLYMFLLYFQNNRDRTYLFYGLYMFFAMYYLLQKIAGDGPYFFLFGEHPMVRHLLNEPLQWLLYIAYNLFIIHFLEIRKYSHRLYNLLKWVNIFYFIYMVLEFSFMLITFDKEIQNMLFIGSRMVVIVISVYIIVDVIKNIQTALVKYIVAGSSLFLLFAILAMVYSLGLNWLPTVNIYPIHFMCIGIMLEILFFSLGLGRRIRLIALHNEKIQEAYIDQLVRNEEIIERSNQKLSQEVERRTHEIMDKTRELEKEKGEKLKSDFEKQLMESKMNTLRLQMNPHFIFNSLNSIRYYILKEDTEQASDYITSFSKLLRMILQHSGQRTIKLSEELEALRLYLEFEGQRFENRFDYSIAVSPSLDPDMTRIQPLIIQPFVENSIWHGLLHKEGKGHLKIEITKNEDNMLEIMVEDDGIGRSKSREYEARKNSSYYKSMGIKITKDRLKMMSSIENGRFEYNISDIVDAHGEPAGTRVVLKIKVL